MIDPLLIPLAAILMVPVMVPAIILVSAKAKRMRNSVTDDDARLLQDMHATVMRLQERVEALETLIVEHSPGGVQK